MKTRTLGNLEVSVVGLGCNQLGTTCDEKASADIVAAALDHGVTLFDTADEYGEGNSEIVLGKALRNRRSEVVIATKFGCRMQGDPLREGASARWIVAAVEDSLRRLGTDYIDLYQQHFPDPQTPVEETLDTLRGLIKAGKVREIGCCNFTAPMIDMAAQSVSVAGRHGFASAQNRLNLLRQEALADVVPACERHGMKMLPFFPLASGVLSGKYRRGEAQPAGTRMGDNVAPDVAARILSDATFDRLDKLGKFAADHGRSLGQLAIAWLIAQPVVASVIAGATRPEQVVANISAADWTFSAGELGNITTLARPAG